MEGNDESKPVKQEGGGNVINLVVKGQDGGEVHFKVKATTRLEKVINAYCQKKSLEAGQIRFLFDGQRVQPTQTPEELGMEDGDSIDCVVEQIGGL